MTAKPKYITPHLKRVGEFLELGELISKLFLKCGDSDRFANKLVDEDPDFLREQIFVKGVEIQELIPTDKNMDIVKKTLGFGTKQPTVESIQVLALVAFYNFSSVHSRETVDSIVIKVSCVFSKSKIEGMLIARKVISRLLKNKTLRVHGTNITVCGSLRAWMAGGENFSSFDLTEKEIYCLHNKKTNNTRTTLKSRIKAVEFLSPQEIYDEIGNQGYVGQDDARRSISLSAYRHVSRLRRIHLDNIPADQLPLRENILLMGSTGSGKSYLINKIGLIIKLPTAFVDATTMTESGYVGDDSNIILTKLYNTADRDLEWSQCGIACFEEYDKLASSGTNNLSFGGDGTRNDVSRGGVQRSLLKMLEEDSVVDCPSEIGINRSPRIAFNTSNVMFMACGAFTGIESIAPSPDIGFGSKSKINEINDISALSKYGIQQEILGRFHSIVKLNQLSAEDLTEILERTTIRRFANELRLSGIELQVEQGVKRMIVSKCLDRGLGARGLSTALLSNLNDACFSAYSSSRPIKSISLYEENDSVHWDLKKHRKSKANKELIEESA